MIKLLLHLLTIVLIHSRSNAQLIIKMEDINNHIGDSVKICTKIYGARFLPKVKDAPTFLDAGNVYPSNSLIILIKKMDRANFDERPEMKYVYKDVCIIGKVDLDNGKARIIVTSPEQISIQY